MHKKHRIFFKNTGQLSFSREALEVIETRPWHLGVYYSIRLVP